MIIQSINQSDDTEYGANILMTTNYKDVKNLRYSDIEKEIVK